MRKIVLITTRDCYPFEKECLAGFEIVDGINVYRDCIRPLMILTDEEMAELNNKAQERGKDIMDLTQRRCIGKLFKDEKAKWTKGTVFEDFKKGGIPLLKKIINNDVFYVLPCTGTTDLDDDKDQALQAPRPRRVAPSPKDSSRRQTAASKAPARQRSPDASSR